MKINGNELRQGMIVQHQDMLWTVVKTLAVKPGKGGAFAQVEMKNVLDGRKLNERFRAADKVERVRLEQKDFQFLFKDDTMATFMDQENYEQIELQMDFIGEEAASFLTDGMTVVLEFYEERPIGLTLPQFVELEIADTEPVVKGQTAANSYKPAVLSNGARTSVPPFVGVGERVIISTEDGTYQKRAE